jgi:hypothetical protein
MSFHGVGVQYLPAARARARRSARCACEAKCVRVRARVRVPQCACTCACACACDGVLPGTPEYSRVVVALLRALEAAPVAVVVLTCRASIILRSHTERRLPWSTVHGHLRQPITLCCRSAMYGPNTGYPPSPGAPAEYP